MPLCIVLFPNIEGANVPTQRRLQTLTNQCDMHKVTQSTWHFSLTVCHLLPALSEISGAWQLASFLCSCLCCWPCNSSVCLSAKVLRGTGWLLSGVGGQDHVALLYFKQVFCLAL